jgi:hypothetical protein
MRTVILSARTGWHTDELCRALGERGHLGVVLPYEGLVAHIGGSEDPLYDMSLKTSGLKTRLYDMSSRPIA